MKSTVSSSISLTISIAILAILVVGIFWLAYEILRTKIGRIVVLCLAVIIAVIALIYSSTHDEFHEVANFQLLKDGTYELIGTNGFECIDVVVPSEYKGSPVTRISDNAFKQCKTLKSVVIPNSVKTIGKSAFYDCNSLERVTISNSVKSIGESAFYSCGKLKSIVIPNSVTTIGESAFSRCDSLTSVTLSNGLTEIDQYAFHSCKSLTSITIPNGVKTINRSAFAFCDLLTSVTLPTSINNIDEHAFGYCRRLTSIKYNGTVDQWNAIEKVEDRWSSIDGILDWDDNTDNYTVYCSDGTIKK